MYLGDPQSVQVGNTVTAIIIIMYSYLVLNTLSAYMVHINLNAIFYTHVEHSPTKTIYIRYYMEKQTLTHVHIAHVRAHTDTHTHTHTRCNEFKQVCHWSLLAHNRQQWSQKASCFKGAHNRVGLGMIQTLKPCCTWSVYWVIKFVPFSLFFREHHSTTVHSSSFMLACHRHLSSLLSWRLSLYSSLAPTGAKFCTWTCCATSCIFPCGEDLFGEGWWLLLWQCKALRTENWVSHERNSLPKTCLSKGKKILENKFFEDLANAPLTEYNFFKSQCLFTYWDFVHIPNRFFDTNPTGRILNRFSADITSIDQVRIFS